jgi:ribonuclease P protein component
MRGAATFRKVFAGHRLHGQSFSLTWNHNDTGYARLGLVVSKRTARHAVDRNRLKRLVRESFRRHRLLLGARDIVVTARHSSVERAGPALLAELENLWRRLPS